MRLRSLVLGLLVVASCSSTKPIPEQAEPPTPTTSVAVTEAPTSPAPTTVPPSTTAAPTVPPVAFRDGGDPLRDQQWQIASLRLPEAWKVATGAGVTIAVVDTGVDLNHPDLKDHLVPGHDFVDGDEVPQDENGHGTHVAGIAAATGGNGIGGSGVAPQASIMPVRVLDAKGSGDDQNIAAGIDWAVQHGANVINLSLGEAGVVARLAKGGPLNQAIRSASEAGAIVVAASGNEGKKLRVYRVPHGVPAADIAAKITSTATNPSADPTLGAGVVQPTVALI